MTITLPGPERKRKLEVLVKCVARAERRIIIAGNIVNFRPVDPGGFPKQWPLIRHLANCMIERGFTTFSESLVRLQVARSKMAAELEGLPWS